MNKNQHPQQTAEIYYNAPRKVDIGDVFYKIEAVDHQHFREPCIVCKGEKMLTVNDVTFKCPCCDDARETIRICGFAVRRYRVFKITDEVNNEEWKPSTVHRVKFDLYRKIGHGYQFASFSTSSFYSSDLCRWLNLSEEDEIRANNVNSYLFDDYQLAVAVARLLTAAEVQKLEEYNGIHGSSYAPVFTTENDKKSI